MLLFAITVKIFLQLHTDALEGTPDDPQTLARCLSLLLNSSSLPSTRLKLETAGMICQKNS